MAYWFSGRVHNSEKQWLRALCNMAVKTLGKRLHMYGMTPFFIKFNNRRSQTIYCVGTHVIKLLKTIKEW